MKETPHITCPNCGKPNLNRDYCAYCGAVINVYLERRLERKKRELKKKKLREENPNTITEFFENAKSHSNVLVRGLATFFYSIWVMVIAIGSFLAFLVSYVAA